MRNSEIGGDQEQRERVGPASKFSSAGRSVGQSNREMAVMVFVSFLAVGKAASERMRQICIRKSGKRRERKENAWARRQKHGN